jgi:hypothetical protein
MIVRKENEQTILIGQTDHSRLAGLFAAHWGNERFAAPEPYEAVVRAAHFHDFGHLRYETAPIFDAATGSTPMFREVPTDEKRLAEYAWCSDWFLAPDPFAALLVDMHRTGLWRNRYDAIAHPAPKPRSLPPMIEEYAARHEAARAAQLAERDWSPQQIRINYRLLQVWDLLSLYFSCQEPYDDYIEPVPSSYADRDGEGVRLTLTPLGGTRVALDPFPFDVNPCRFQLSARRLPRARYDDRDAFVRAYFQAPLELLEYELVAGATANRPDRAPRRPETARVG